ncbi:TPA: autotransporter outer membrane beta-barrel domain-containing protein [Morganella morganii]
MMKKSKKIIYFFCFCGFSSLSHADYTPSKDINKIISSYDYYAQISNELDGLSIKTPGNGTYPNTAISLIYNGDDSIDFAGKQLRIKNLEITASKAPPSKYGYRAGISSLSNNIYADNIKLTSFDDDYYGIRNANNENFDNKREELSTSRLILENSEFNLHGKNSKGIYTYKTSINPDSFSHVEINNSDFNIFGDNSVGIQAVNASSVSNKSNFYLNGNNGVGISVYNTSKVLIDNSSMIYSKSDSATGILLSRFSVPLYWADDLKDDQQVTIDNSSVIDVKNGTGIRAAAGNNTVNVSNSSQIISKNIINAKKASEDYKNHPTNINLNVSDKSIISGAAITEQDATSSVNISSGSVWNITGDSNVTNLKSDNAIVNFNKDKMTFTTTHVDTLSGNNSTLNFSVDVEKQAGSKLIINKSSTGSHIVQVSNDGTQNTTGNEEITLIEDKSGTNSTAVFYPGKDVELGGYTYQVKRDESNSDNWILTAKPGSGSENKPSPNNTSKAITGMTSTSYLINQAEMHSLRQRTGDLTSLSGESSSDNISGLWGRVYGGNYKTKNNNNLEKVDMNYYGFQIGGEKNTVYYGHNKNFLGIFIGHTTGKPDYDYGDATTTSWYGGVYNTFIAENGIYVESVVKIGQYRNKYNLRDSQGNAIDGKAQSKILTISSQLGKRFILDNNGNYNIYAEPQIQLIYSRIDKFNTTASNGLNIKQNAYNPTTGRLGVLLGSRINRQSDIYLKASYFNEFSKDVKYTLNNSPEYYSVNGDGLEVGVGVNLSINNNSYLYAEGDYINSKSNYTGSKFNIGYRYTF